MKRINISLIVILAILAGVAVGFSLNMPDVQTPFTKPAPKIKVIVVESSGNVARRLDEMIRELGVDERSAKALRHMTVRESGDYHGVSPAAGNRDDELKTIECSQAPRNNDVFDCDCWVYGRCETELDINTRFRQCYDRTKDRNDCECWVHDEAPAGTLCWMFYKRDTCDERLTTPEMQDECDHYWVNKLIPKRLGWDE